MFRRSTSNFRALLEFQGGTSEVVAWSQSFSVANIEDSVAGRERKAKIVKAVISPEAG